MPGFSLGIFDGIAIFTVQEISTNARFSKRFLGVNSPDSFFAKNPVAFCFKNR